MTDVIIYDESTLLSSPFYVALRNSIENFDKVACEKRYIVAVPIPGSFVQEKFPKQLLSTHIMTPSPYFQNQYITLTGKTVELSSNFLFTRKEQRNGAGFLNERSCEVLFESEVCDKYNPRMSFKLLLIDKPLEGSFHQLNRALFGIEAWERKSIDDIMNDFYGDHRNEKAIEQLNKNIYIFLNCYSLPLTELGKQDCILKIDRMITDAFALATQMNPQWNSNGMSPLKRLLLKRVVETCVMERLGDKVMSCLREIHYQSDELLSTGIRYLQENGGVPISELGLKYDLFEAQGISTAVNTINQLNNATSVLEKLRIICRAIKEIISETKRKVKLLKGKTMDLSSDDLLPLLIMTLVQSDVMSFNATCDYCMEFDFTNLKYREFEYCFVTFLASISFLKEYCDRLFTQSASESTLIFSHIHKLNSFASYHSNTTTNRPSSSPSPSPSPSSSHPKSFSALSPLKPSGLGTNYPIPSNHITTTSTQGMSEVGVSQRRRTSSQWEYVKDRSSISSAEWGREVNRTSGTYESDTFPKYGFRNESSVLVNANRSAGESRILVESTNRQLSSSSLTPSKLDRFVEPLQHNYLQKESERSQSSEEKDQESSDLSTSELMPLNGMDKLAWRSFMQHSGNLLASDMSEPVGGSQVTDVDEEPAWWTATKKSTIKRKPLPWNQSFNNIETVSQRNSMDTSPRSNMCQSILDSPTDDLLTERLSPRHQSSSTTSSSSEVSLCMNRVSSVSKISTEAAVSDSNMTITMHNNNPSTSSSTNINAMSASGVEPADPSSSTATTTSGPALCASSLTTTTLNNNTTTTTVPSPIAEPSSTSKFTSPSSQTTTPPAVDVCVQTPSLAPPHPIPGRFGSFSDDSTFRASVNSPYSPADTPLDERNDDDNDDEYLSVSSVFTCCFPSHSLLGGRSSASSRSEQRRSSRSSADSQPVVHSYTAPPLMPFANPSIIPLNSPNKGMSVGSSDSQPVTPKNAVNECLSRSSNMSPLLDDITSSVENNDSHTRAMESKSGTSTNSHSSMRLTSDANPSYTHSFTNVRTISDDDQSLVPLLASSDFNPKPQPFTSFHDLFQTTHSPRSPESPCLSSNRSSLGNELNRSENTHGAGAVSSNPQPRFFGSFSTTVPPVSSESVTAYEQLLHKPITGSGIAIPRNVSLTTTADMSVVNPLASYQPTPVHSTDEFATTPSAVSTTTTTAPSSTPTTGNRSHLRNPSSPTSTRSVKSPSLNTDPPSFLTSSPTVTRHRLSDIGLRAGESPVPASDHRLPQTPRLHNSSLSQSSFSYASKGAASEKKVSDVMRTPECSPQKIIVRFEFDSNTNTNTNTPNNSGNSGNSGMYMSDKGTTTRNPLSTSSFNSANSNYGLSSISPSSSRSRTHSGHVVSATKPSDYPSTVMGYTNSPSGGNSSIGSNSSSVKTNQTLSNARKANIDRVLRSGDDLFVSNGNGVMIEFMNPDSSQPTNNNNMFSYGLSPTSLSNRSQQQQQPITSPVSAAAASSSSKPSQTTGATHIRGLSGRETALFDSPDPHSSVNSGLGSFLSSLKGDHSDVVNSQRWSQGPNDLR